MKNYNRMSKKDLLALLASSNLIGERRPNVKNSEDAVKTVASVIINWKQENFVAVYLDGANNVLDVRLLHLGTLNQSLVHPRELFAPAIELRSLGVIVAHNHPSGGIEPSADDLALTKRLQEAGKILGIELMDHLIVTADGYYSFRKAGLM
ncbi:MAG TPA: JAB domain-containing protein [bacterium]|nr:JAB domain-containing protein [bacterium]